MMFAMLLNACQRLQLPYASVPDILFAAGVLDNDWNTAPSILPYFKKHYLYYGFRYWPPVLDQLQDKIRASKCVLLIRDPRDALVSEYFSYGGSFISHRVPEKEREKFLSQFRESENMLIDEYVIAHAQPLRKKLLIYAEKLDSKNTRIFKYEDVIFKKADFLRNIFEHFEISAAPSVIEGISKRFDIVPKEEDRNAHIRRVTPGDHKNKLKPETIEQLNMAYADVARIFRYEMT
jgi:sulfotransferase family protein